MENQVTLLDTGWLKDPDLFGFWYQKMPADRRKTIDAFRRDRDRRLSLGAGILLHQALGRAGVDHVRLSRGPYGKPFLADRQDIHFNLSHAGQIAACALSDRPVGIDIEEEQCFEDDLLRFVFLDPEIDWIREKTDSLQAGATALWTIKESLMKLLGTGLSLEPKQICIDPEGPISAAWPGQSGPGPFFTRYEIKGYQLTVCSEYQPFSGRPEWVIPQIGTM